jgi:hypothetical protein
MKLQQSSSVHPPPLPFVQHTHVSSRQDAVSASCLAEIPSLDEEVMATVGCLSRACHVSSRQHTGAASCFAETPSLDEKVERKKRSVKNRVVHKVVEVFVGDPNHVLT